MEVILAKTAGFCFGVRRAVDTVYEQVEQAEGPIYTYGPIVHNETVVRELEDKGVRVLNSEAELAAVAFERIDGAALDEFDLSVAGFEDREVDHLHEILFDVDHIVEPVADHDAVGFDVRRDDGHLLLGPGREDRSQEKPRQEQNAARRYGKVSFHRCLKSFISSAT